VRTQVSEKWLRASITICGRLERGFAAAGTWGEAPFEGQVRTPSRFPAFDPTLLRPSSSRLVRPVSVIAKRSPLCSQEGKPNYGLCSRRLRPGVSKAYCDLNLVHRWPKSTKLRSFSSHGAYIANPEKPLFSIFFNRSASGLDSGPKHALWSSEMARVNVPLDLNRTDRDPARNFKQVSAG